jgi:hypothetical protein
MTRPIKYQNGHIFQSDIGELKLLIREEADHEMGRFQCFCGEIFWTKVKLVATGKTRSCGCYRIRLSTQRVLRATRKKIPKPDKEKVSQDYDYLKSHGHAVSNKRTYLYRYWQWLKANHRDRMSVSWLDFENFLDYVKTNLEPRPAPNYYISRINKDFGYYRGNLYWKFKNRKVALES